jgi:predicted RecA/RadA family phage recombinase
MQNFVQEGDVVTLTAPYARSSGQGALVGSIFGVAVADVANGASGEFKTKGVFDLAKTSAQAWTFGALLYWDDTNKVVTNTSNTGANKLIGVAMAVAANPSSTGRVRLNGAFST